MRLFSTTQLDVVLKTLIGVLLTIFITTIRLKQARVERFMGKIMMKINVWRSIDGMVKKDSLALMNATTLGIKDLVRTKIPFNDMKTADKHQEEVLILIIRVLFLQCILLFYCLKWNERSKQSQSIKTITYMLFDE